MYRLDLMTTEGCHLCEEAIAVLGQTLQAGQAEVDLVDIVYDEGLMARYATRIPVLVDRTGGGELDWPFDAEQLGAFLQRCDQS